MVAKMILYYWRDSRLSMADLGLTPLFQDFTRGRSRFVKWQWDYAAKHCPAEAQQLSCLRAVRVDCRSWCFQCRIACICSGCCYIMNTVYQEHTLIFPQNFERDLSSWTSSIGWTNEVSTYFLYVSSTACGDQHTCPPPVTLHFRNSC